MTKSMLKRLFRSLAFRIVIAVVILYTVYHCVAALSDRVVTDVITTGTDRLTVSGQAVLFRDETVVTLPGGHHLISYPQENGAATLAELYPSYTDEETRRRAQITLRALDRQIALAQQLPLSDMLASLPGLQAEAREQILQNSLLTSAGGSLSEVDRGAFELLLCLNRIEALTEQATSSASLLAALRAERQTLLGFGTASQPVTALGAGIDTTGYFFYADSVDGYEDIFTRASLATMTIADFEALMQRPSRTYGSGETVVGKIVRYCLEKGKTLETMSLAEYKEHSEVFDEDVLKVVKATSSANSRNSVGGSSMAAAKAGIKSLRSRLKKLPTYEE